MSDTELPWKFLGRKVRPYAFAVTFVCIVLTVALLVTGDDVGNVLDNDENVAGHFNLVGYTIGVTAMLAGIFLIAGWWLRSDRFMRWGLLVSAFMFATRAAFLFMDLGWHHVPGWISLGWVLASGGAWLLERTTLQRKGD